MATIVRSYGTAQYGSTSPIAQGSTTAGSGATYTTALCDWIERDGFVTLTFNMTYTGLAGGLVGRQQVRLPGAPLPKYSVIGSCSITGTGGAIGGGVDHILESYISNLDSTTVVDLYTDNITTNAITDVEVEAAATIRGTFVYPTSS
jgi:hypothetical protein